MSGAAERRSKDTRRSLSKIIPHCESELHNTFVSYLHALTSSSKPLSFVWMEHSYARAGVGAATASSNGTRLLLVRRAPQCPDCHVQGAHEDDIIDIEGVEDDVQPPLMLDELPYWEKALVDCDMIGEEEDLKPDWEEKIHSLAWNSAQSLLLIEALTIIHSTRAALLTAGLAGAKRAAARGGGARSLRALLATPQTRWQPCLAQWLHNALTEHLPTPLLACYREIMLTMKSKVPILVEKMTMFHPLNGRIHGAENGATGPTIASASTPSDPQAPLLLLVPSGRDKRDARWAERLRAIAQVHIVHSHQTSWPPNLPVTSCLSQLVNTAKARAESLKLDNPRRPLILVGQGPGAAIAAQLAVSVPGIAGLVCLGLPLLTAEGPRGTPEDCLLDLPCPVLFVIGQNASNCTQQDAEVLRCKLRVKSRLVVAGSADELLRLPRLKRQLEGVTQRMLECTIAEEVSLFLSFLLHHDNDGYGCSSPDSYNGGPDLDKNSSSIMIPKREPIGSNINRHRPLMNIPNNKKRIRHKPMKTISPIKSRGSALYEVNNPPPEGATISISDILNTKVSVDEDPMIEARSSLSPPAKRFDTNSYVQIGNNQLRSIPITGNGSYESISKSGIKVLENSVYKGPGLSSSMIKSKLASATGLTTHLPMKMVIKEEQGTSTTPNIMDLPIVFADDTKLMDTNLKLTNQQQYKTIFINKQQVIPSLNESGQKNMVHLTVPSSSSLSQNQPLIVNKTNINNPMKYTKLILTKRPSLDSTKTESSDAPKTQVISKPIIVKGNKGLATFKVLHGNILQGTNMLQSKQRLIIKRAVVPSSLNVNSQTSGDVKKFAEAQKVDGETLRENAKNESAIEAAVASITGQDFLKNLLGDFD